MCAPDPNAGIRMQAKIENQKKQTRYHSESLKYWNREVSVKQRQGAISRGLSRSRSDAYSRALWALGKGRLAQEGVERSKAKVARFADKTGLSRSNRYMSAKYKSILDKQRQIESTINTTFGRNMDIAHQMIMRNHMNQVAKNRTALGARPEYGAPVMMPPRDRAGQFFNSLSIGLGILSIFSDIRLKENITQVGQSADGHKIYEFNYIGNKSEKFRGVMAQEVVKKDPMAVNIRKLNDRSYLTVDYSKIDVEMEVVS